MQSYKPSPIIDKRQQDYESYFRTWINRKDQQKPRPHCLLTGDCTKWQSTTPLFLQTRAFASSVHKCAVLCPAPSLFWHHGSVPTGRSGPSSSVPSVPSPRTPPVSDSLKVQFTQSPVPSSETKFSSLGCKLSSSTVFHFLVMSPQQSVWPVASGILTLSPTGHFSVHGVCYGDTFL